MILRVLVLLALVGLLAACGDSSPDYPNANPFLTIYTDQDEHETSQVWCGAGHEIDGDFQTDLLENRFYYTGTITAEIGESFCRTEYNLADDFFVFDFEHERGPLDRFDPPNIITDQASATTGAIIRFSLSSDSAYTITAHYNVEDDEPSGDIEGTVPPGARDSLRISLASPEEHLLDVLLRSVGYLDTSFRLSDVDESFVHSDFSDIDYPMWLQNELYGSVTGTLKADEIYQFEIAAEIVNRNDQAPAHNPAHTGHPINPVLPLGAIATGQIRIDFYPIEAPQ